MGGRKKVGAKQERQPPVSEAWGTLTDTAVSMLETVAFLREDASADCNYHAVQLSELSKHRARYPARMQLLDGIARLIENYMPAFCGMDAEDVMEHGVAGLFDNFYGSLFWIIRECMEAFDKVKSEKLRDELQRQISWSLRTIRIVIAASFNVDRPSALDSIKPFVDPLFDICCSHILLNRAGEYGYPLRRMAMRVMAVVLGSRSLLPILRTNEGSNLLKLVVDTAFKLCADDRDTKRERDADDNGDGSDSDEEEELAKLNPTLALSQNLGTHLLDVVIFGVTAADVVSDHPASRPACPLILHKAQAILNDAPTNKLDRQAALICLAVLPESASPFVTQPDILPNVMALLQRCMSPNVPSLVRAAAFISLAEHLEHLQPAIAVYHEQWMQKIMQVVKDAPEVSNAMVKSKAIVALQPFCVLKKLPAKYRQSDSSDNLAVFLLDQIKSLISKRVHTLSSGERDMLVSSLDALSSFAETYAEAVKESTLPDGLGRYFEPYVGDAYNVAISLLENATDDDLLLVRARAAALVGSVVACQSKEQVQQQMEKLAPLITSTFEYEPDVEEDESLQDELHTLRGSLYFAVGVIAQRLGAGVEQYVESLIPFFCRTMSADYDGAAADDDEEEEEDEEDEDESSKADDERKLAIECMKELVTALGPRFIPFNERVFGLLSENAKTYAADVQSPLASLLELLATELYPPPAGVTPLSQAGVVIDLSADGINQLKQVRALLFDYVQEVSDPDVIESSFVALHSLMKTYGQRVIDDEEELAAFQSTLMQLLEGVDDEGENEEEEGEEEEEQEEEAEEEEEKEDENENEDEEEEEEDDDSAEAASFNDSLCDVIGALAKLRGLAFSPFLDRAWPHLLGLRTQARQYRASVNALFADVAESVELFTPRVKQVLEVLLVDINDDKFSTLLWRNTAYALGQIFLRMPIELTQQALKPAADAFQARLTQLDAAITKEKQDESAKVKLAVIQACRDNIISAIGKMIMVGSVHLPLDRLVPLFVSSLPLTSDTSENQSVLAACSKLVNAFPSAHPGVIEPHFTTLLKLFATVVATMGEEKVSDRVKKFVVQSARNILARQPSLRAELVDKAEDENMKVLRSKIDEAQDEHKA